MRSVWMSRACSGASLPQSRGFMCTNFVSFHSKDTWDRMAPHAKGCPIKEAVCLPRYLLLVPQFGVRPVGQEASLKDRALRISEVVALGREIE